MPTSIEPVSTALAGLAIAYPPMLPDGIENASLGNLADIYKSLLAEKDAANIMLKKVNAAIEAMATTVRYKLGEADLEKIAGDGITISLADKPVVKIDEQKWEAIAKTLMERGEFHLVQRRITASRVQDMVDEGIRLPDGMTLESFPTVKHRRS